MFVYLSLGSNMGDRKAALDCAIEEIGALPATKVEKVSDYIETAAQGFEGNDFVNCCALISTGIPPQRLLGMLKEIERKLGRCSEGSKYDSRGARIYTDRPIDIDILLCGRRKINTETLTVPHPRMYERDFVLKPLKQIYTKI